MVFFSPSQWVRAPAGSRPPGTPPFYLLGRSESARHQDFASGKIPGRAKGAGSRTRGALYSVSK